MIKSQIGRERFLRRAALSSTASIVCRVGETEACWATVSIAKPNMFGAKIPDAPLHRLAE
jgi:hypothetical protein